MTSTRKRAVLACTYCRRRKRRCDGGTPTCGTCAEKQIICSYSKPESPSADSRNASILRDRILGRNGSLYQTHDNINRPEEFHRTIRSNEVSVNSITESPRPWSDFGAQNSSIPSATWLFNSPRDRPPQFDIDDDAHLPPLTIPLGHQTSTSSLLLLPQMQALVGVYPEDFFFRVESNRRLQPAIPLTSLIDGGGWQVPSIDHDVAMVSIDRFFETVHTVKPFLDKATFLSRYDAVLHNGLGVNNESAVVLAVLALGAIGGTPGGNGQVFHEDTPGMGYLTSALHILTSSWMTSFTGDIVLSQGLVICALYFCCLVQPLPAWKLIHMASTNLQQLLIRSKNMVSDPVDIEEITRISWSCFLIECDLLSEFHQPRSGIEPLVDKMPYPYCGPSPGPENLAFMAEISVRFLLNRVQHSIYFADNITIFSGRLLDSLASHLSSPPMPDSSLLNVSAELNRQLESWYDALQAIIRPDLSSEEDDGNLQRHVLRMRYWSAKHIIYRPFVIYATSLPPHQSPPTSILDKCQLCLSSCRMFLSGSKEWLRQHSPYTYHALHTCLASALMLSLAAVCPCLADLVPDIDALMSVTIGILRPWAAPATSIECALEILISVQKKLRYRD